MHDVTSQVHNDRPTSWLHVVSSTSRLVTAVGLSAGSGGVHAQPHLVAQAGPEQIGPGVCCPGDSQR